MAYSKELLDFISQLNPYVVQNLRRGLELGRWSDGKLLTEQQQSLVLEALLIWEQQTHAKQPTGVVPKQPRPVDIHAQQALTIAAAPHKDTSGK